MWLIGVSCFYEPYESAGRLTGAGGGWPRTGTGSKKEKTTKNGKAAPVNSVHCEKLHDILCLVIAFDSSALHYATAAAQLTN